VKKSVAGVEGVSESLFEESDHASESLEERSEVKKLGVEVDEERRGRVGTRGDFINGCSKTDKRRALDVGEVRRMAEDMLANAGCAVLIVKDK